MNNYVSDDTVSREIGPILFSRLEACEKKRPPFGLPPDPILNPEFFDTSVRNKRIKPGS